MKASALVIILLAVTSASFALHPVSADPETLACRSYVIDLHLQLTSSQIAHFDLTHGIWQEDDRYGGQRTYQFNDDGLADILETSANGRATYHNAQWSVKAFDDLVVLTMKERDDYRERLFNLERTCEGVVLTGLTNMESFNLIYQPLAGQKKLNRLKKSLVGEWTNVTLTKNAIKGALKTIKFRSDGTFLMEREGVFQPEKEQGVWEISKDGKYLLFYVAEGLEQDGLQETVVVKINSVDDHSLELVQPVEFAEGNMDVKAFAFIR